MYYSLCSRKLPSAYVMHADWQAGAVTVTATCSSSLRCFLRPTMASVSRPLSATMRHTDGFGSMVSGGSNRWRRPRRNGNKSCKR